MGKSGKCCDDDAGCCGKGGCGCGALAEHDRACDQIAQALTKRKRVWLISTDGVAPDAVDREKVRLLLDGYRVTKVDIVHKFQVTLWQRTAAR